MNTPSSAKRSRHLAAAPLVTVLLALTAAACGGSSSGGGTAATSSSPASQGSESGSSSAPSADAASIISSAGKVDGTSFCGKKDITLGIQDGFGINSWSQESMAAVRTEAAKCPNVKQLVQIGGGDLQKSISQVNSFVAQGADAIVVIPDFGPAEFPSIQQATRAGVKVVPWGADPGGTPGKDYVAYVDWSSPNAGTQWATWMVKALHGKGNVVMIGGPAGNPVTAGQLKSIVAVFAQNPGMKLLTGDTDWAVTNWDPAQAQKTMSALLGKYPQIDGVISDYGTDAVAATRAFENAGRKLVPFATLDSYGMSCAYEKDGGKNLQLATISSRNWLGRIAARKAIAAAEGVADNEPSTYTLPFFEDSLSGKKPKCDAAASSDFSPSSQLTPADISKYGKA